MFSDPSGHWKYNGNTATAERGDTLWGLAAKRTGNGNNWKKLGFARDPKMLQIGERIDISVFGSTTNTPTKPTKGGTANTTNPPPTQTTPTPKPTPSSTPTPTQVPASGNSGVGSNIIWSINGTYSSKITTTTYESTRFQIIPGVFAQSRITTTLTNSSGIAGYILTADAYSELNNSSSYNFGVTFTALSMYGINVYITNFGFGFSASMGYGDISYYISGKCDIFGYSSVSVGMKVKNNDGVTIKSDYSINGDTMGVLTAALWLYSVINFGALPVNEQKMIPVLTTG